MSYSRWGSPGLGWYIYRQNHDRSLFVSPGCPHDLKGCPLHSPKEGDGKGHCVYAESLSKERVEMLRDILNDALEEWDR